MKGKQVVAGESSTDLDKLLEIKKRYDHVLALVRESRCVCNSARSFGDVARELLDYLLQGDVREVVTLEIPVELRAYHCPVHSPPLENRPWLLCDESQVRGRLDRDGVAGQGEPR